MDSDEGKLFIGGIGWETTEETLREHFGKYGEVSETVIMLDKITQRPRGFGFVVFSDPSLLDSVLKDTHFIDGRTVEAKRALSREEQQTSRSGNSNASRSYGGAGNYRTKKIFVGGLPSTLTDEEFSQYFENYGQVTDVVIMFDQTTNRPRGFGFITFDSEDAVDKVLHKTYHELNNKLVEVKRAQPKDAQQGSSGGSSRGRGGGYQGYGSSGANASSYEGGIGGNRFMQPQSTGGGYPPYSGYGPPSYGYGAANGSVGYGGYGVGGYGNGNVGFGGPSGAYGNPSGAASAMKSAWGSQTPGYGAGYGAAPSGPVAQSANQGYGYGGNYGGSDSGYGNVGGRSGNVSNNYGSNGYSGY